MTIDEAEQIEAAAAVGMFRGTRSELATALLILGERDLREEYELAAAEVWGNGP